jgi:hypothetical protein
MISPADIVALPKGQAFVLLRGSELWKIRIPMPSKMDDQELPDDLGQMLQHMRKSYASVVDWPSYYGREARVINPWPIHSSISLPREKNPVS